VSGTPLWPATGDGLAGRQRLPGEVEIAAAFAPAEGERRLLVSRLPGVRPEPVDRFHGCGCPPPASPFVLSPNADPDLGDHIRQEKQMTGSNAEQAISQEKYVSVATFRKTGVPIATATWVVPVDGGRVGLLTSSASGKVKRLRNTPRLTLQPGDVRGRIKAGTTAVTGTVELVTSGPDFEAITSAMKAKYGLMVPVMRLVDSMRHLGKGPFPYADTGVVITLQG
jgi:hypothetical protein